MASIVLGAAVVLACSALAGQGICTLAGRERWEWWAPGAGFALLLGLAGLLVRAPGHDKTAAAAIAVVTIAALASRTTRAAVISALPEGLPLAAFTLLVSLLPFLVSGRTAIIGAGVNNDMGAHLGTAWWIVHERGPAPVGALGGPLAEVGYPLGPHGLAASLAVGHASLVHAFDAVVVVVPTLIALVAMGVSPATPRLARWPAALFVGLGYLTVSFTVQASFKETMEGLLLIAAVLATRDVLADTNAGASWRSGLPIGMIAGGAVWVYSYGGLSWTIGAVVAVALVTPPLRRALRVAPGALVGLALLVGPALPAMLDFASSPFNHESGTGNLGHALNPLEALGVWPVSDFRWTPDPFWPTILLASVAGLVGFVAIARLVRAKALALPAALIPTLAIYAWAADEKSIYLSAKALTIAAPMVAMVIAGGLVMPAMRMPRPALHVPVAALGLLTAGAAAVSSFVALRDGRVGPDAHAAELAQLKPLLEGSGPVLFMAKDDFAQWELVGLRAYKPGPFYAPLYVEPRPSKSTRPGGFYDFDSFLPSTLDRFDYAITARTPFQSRPPANWRPATDTRSYVLWRRHGRTPLRFPADFADRPGRILLCNTEFGRSRLGGAGAHGFAEVRQPPIVGRQIQWRGQTFHAGDSATMTLRVPRGVWDLSLEYASMTGLRLRAGALHVALPATIDRVGPFYFVGTLRQSTSGPLVIRVTANRMSGFARLLGARGLTRALDSPSHRPLEDVALTPHPWRGSRVAPSAACKRWVDFVQPG